MGFKRKLSQGVGTGATQVGTYAAPAAGAVIIGLIIGNNSTTTAINVDVYLDTGTVYYMVRGAPITVGGALVVVGGDQKVVLESGDKIYVRSDVAGTADVILSILEN